MKLTEDARVREALELLNAVAADQRDDLREAISTRYSSLKDAVTEMGNNTQNRVSTFYTTGKAKVRETAHAVDDNVHNNAWLYIGGTAVAALLLGYVLGRSKSRD